MKKTNTGLRWTALVSILLLAIPFAGRSQTQVFTVDHNGTASVYYNLDTAIANAQTGDAINLPGGIINFSGTIRKGVNLVGAGFFLDSTIATGRTILTTAVNVKLGASGFTMSGVLLQSSLSIDSCSNVLVQRCQLNSFVSTNSSNLVVNGCVLSSINSGATTSNLVVRNCLIYSYIYANAISVTNCILFGGYQIYNSSAFLFHYGVPNAANPSNAAVNSTFSNNIIYLQNGLNDYYTGGYNYYNNNVFTQSIQSQINASFQNNIFGPQLVTLLVNNPTTTAYTPGNNFHLAANSPAIGAGLGGTDCGIYGGTTPWKEGAVPYNPHIQQANIPGITDQNGNLLVDFKVKAQDN